MKSVNNSSVPFANASIEWIIAITPLGKFQSNKSRAIRYIEKFQVFKIWQIIKLIKTYFIIEENAHVIINYIYR